MDENTRVFQETIGALLRRQNPPLLRLAEPSGILFLRPSRPGGFPSGGCERIYRTPIPVSYTSHSARPALPLASARSPPATALPFAPDDSPERSSHAPLASFPCAPSRPLPHGLGRHRARRCALRPLRRLTRPPLPGAAERTKHPTPDARSPAPPRSAPPPPSQPSGGRCSGPRSSSPRSAPSSSLPSRRSASSSRSPSGAI